MQTNLKEYSKNGLNMSLDSINKGILIKKMGRMMDKLFLYVGIGWSSVIVKKAAIMGKILL